MSNYIERMLRELPGVEPAEKTLDTPEKRCAYEQRMEEATREQMKRDRRAAMESALAAKSKILD